MGGSIQIPLRSSVVQAASNSLRLVSFPGLRRAPLLRIVRASSLGSRKYRLAALNETACPVAIRCASATNAGIPVFGATSKCDAMVKRSLRQRDQSSLRLDRDNTVSGSRTLAATDSGH